MACQFALFSLAFLSSFASAIPLSSRTSGVDVRTNVESDSRFNYPLDKRDTKLFPLRVLPLGASITFGTASSDGNGYRKALRDQLRFEGWDVNMVGNQQGGSMADNDNSGYPGFRVEQVAKQAEGVVGRQPNVITINAGTNDANQNFQIDTVGQRMDKMIDMLFEKIPGVTILLSTVLQTKNADKDKVVKKINPQYRALVERRRKQNQRIVLADMYESDKPWLNVADLKDGIHPTDAGYKKMAAIWWKAFQEAEKAGMLQPPNKATLINRCEKNTVDAGKIRIPEGFYNAVQPVQITDMVKNDVQEAVWAKDNDGFYIYKWINNSYVDGARLELKTNCWAKDVRWLDVNGDGLSDFVCLDNGKGLHVQLNKGGAFPPQFEDVGKCTVPHSGDDGAVVNPQLPPRS